MFFIKNQANKQLFEKIQSINHLNKTIGMYKYNETAYEIIQQINKPDSDVNRIYDEVMKKLLCTTSIEMPMRINFHQQLKNSVWLAFLKKENLSNENAVEILRNTVVNVSAEYLCLPHTKMSFPVKYAIDNIDHLSLKVIASMVDINKMPDFIITELFPFISYDIIGKDNFNNILKKVQNDKMILSFINRYNLSQNQIKCICENSNISEETRNSAFMLLEDVTSLSNMTTEMKENLYFAAVETVLNYEGPPNEYIDTAHIYLINATCNPDKILTEDLEKDLVKRVMETSRRGTHRYITNLIANTKNESVLQDIFSQTENTMLAFQVGTLCNKLTNNLFSAFIYRITTKLDCGDALLVRDIELLENFMHHDIFTQYIETEQVKELFDVALKHNQTGNEVQLLFASTIGTSQTMLKNIIEQGCSDAVCLAKLHLTLINTQLLNKEKEILLHAIYSLSKFDSSEYFGLMPISTKSEPSICQQMPVAKENVCLIYPNNGKTLKILNSALDKLQTDCTYGKGEEYKIAIESLKTAINRKYDNDNTHWLSKWSIYRMLKKISELQDILHDCKNELEYYEFVQTLGKEYTELYDNIKIKLKKEKIEKIPSNLIEIF